MQVLATQQLPPQAWPQRSSPFGCAACGAYWLLLWCLLKLTTGCCFCGLVGGTLVQANVRCYLCLVLGNLFGATKRSTVAAAPVGWVCAGLTKLCTTAGFYQRWAQGQARKPEIFLCLPPPFCCGLGSGAGRACAHTELHERASVRRQAEVSGVHQADTRSDSVV